jgi:excisionase family DNA binding protein
METVLAIDEAAQRTGQPVRRLRQWCATGRLRCERDRRGWLIPEAEIARVSSIAATRAVRGSDRTARALVVPRSARGSTNLRGQVAAELRIPTTTVSIDGLTIDGQAYVIATWPGLADSRGSALADLAEELDGELLD